MVAAWSVDRLGRSLTDLLGILQGLHDRGVDLFLHQQGIDTSTTAGRDDVPDARRVRRVRAGQHQGKGECRVCAGQGEGNKAGTAQMRPSVEARIRELKAEGMGILKIGRTVGVGTSVVQRVVGAS